MPNSRIPQVGLRGELFGKASTFEEASVVVVPVPYELTVSDRLGTGKAPEAVFAVSSQLDYGVYGVDRAWTLPIHGLADHDLITDLSTASSERWVDGDGDDDGNGALQSRVRAYYARLEAGEPPLSTNIDTNIGADVENKLLSEVAEAYGVLLGAVRSTVHGILAKGKIAVVLGGEHSVSLGAIQAASAVYPNMGVLHIDAHMDLHASYGGMPSAHACVMHQVLATTGVPITQVGIRAFAPEEAAMAAAYSDRVRIFYQSQLDAQQFEGGTWQQCCSDIIETLPADVYISVDIDGLALANGLSTGTPVPNGLSLGAFYYLLAEVAKRRRVVGCDLVEVVPSADGTAERVAATILYHLCVWAGFSQQRLG